jgi:phosphatidate cytidylyltransferase
MPKNDILIRTLTGAIFITSILVSIYLNSQITISVFGLYLLMALIEFSNFFKEHETVSLSSIYFIGLGMIIYLLFSEIFIEILPYSSLFIVFPLIFIYLLIEIWRNKTNPIINLSVGIFGIIYIVVPFILLIVLTEKTTLIEPILTGMFLIIWANDTFAYLFGRFLGKRKLMERISPKKSWEGVIGGFVFTILFSWLVAYFLDSSHDYIFWIISAIIISPASILGDLLESMFKRSLEIKDSGTILPGHGGILDRFDATLIAVPFFFSWYFLYHLIILS